MNSTHTTRQVLAALLRTDGEATGYDVVKATGLLSGTVYPILHRLQDRELVTGREGRAPRRRPRIYYQLTDKGRAAAQEAANGLSPLILKEIPKP